LYVEKKHARKEAKKESAREKGAARLEASRERIAAMDAEQLAALEVRREAGRAEREARKAGVVAAKAACLASPFNVVIDCSFTHLMSEKEVKSVVHQFALCNAANVRATPPLRLSFAALEGPLAAGLTAIVGFPQWPLVTSAAPAAELFPDRVADMVYLTADSENELCELRESDIYLVGGFVDRNRHKLLTLQKAQGAGMRHARLPIGAHLALSSSAVLTVNQVIELLLAWLRLRDWGAACREVVPQRKRTGPDGEAPASRRQRREDVDDGEAEAEVEAEEE